MATYNVARPSMPASQLTKSILYRVFFPPILLWDFAKWGVNKLLGEMVSYIVLPAQNMKLENNNESDSADEQPTRCFYSDDDSDDDDAKLATHSYTVSEVARTDATESSLESLKVTTHDGASLDTLQITPSSLVNKPDIEKKFIINFVGNAMSYEDVIEEIKNNAKALNRVVIGFNLRGVKKSTGQAKSKDDLVTDGIAQVQRLLDAGVPSQNITLKGHSLGGALATMVAHHFHQQGRPLYLFNDRSFSSITNFVVGQIRTAGTGTGHKETFGMKLLGWIAKPFIKLGVSLVKWEINADDAYKGIPEAFKEYILVRSKKSAREASAEQTPVDDSVITHYASLHHALKSERRAQKVRLDSRISRLQKDMNPGDGQTAEELKALQAKREYFEARKMVSQFPGFEAHCNSIEDLENRSGLKHHSKKSGAAFFQAFIERQDAHQHERASACNVI